MADTDFTDGVTVVPAEWLNAVNDCLHTYLGINAASGAPTRMQFPATQSASSDPNALDDYEEGSFTPVLAGLTTAGTQTYSVQLGRYVKIGKLVTIHGVILLSAKDAATAGNMYIGGLPFASELVSGINYSGSIGQYANIDFSTGYTQLGIYVEANGTRAFLTQGGDNVAAGVIAAAAIGANTEIDFTLTYRAAS